MAKDRKKSQIPLGKIIGALIVLSMMDSDVVGFLIVMALPAIIGWIAFRFLKKQGRKSRQERPQPLDDCPKPVCFHKDKGVHHVVRGRERDPWDIPRREVDPWDRPDIDIRKYQRR